MAQTFAITNGDITFGGTGQPNMSIGSVLLKQAIVEYILERINLTQGVVGQVQQSLDDVIETFILLRLEIILAQLKSDLEQVIITRIKSEQIGKLGLILVQRDQVDPTLYNFFVQVFSKDYSPVEIQDTVG